MIHHGGMLITAFRQKMKENVDLTTIIIDEMSDEDISKLVHDLWNRQVELEVQNEELRQAHTRLETSQQKYVGLYDFAPIGYCTLTKDGLILEANLTIADQVGLERDQLINTQFHHYIVEEDRKIFSQHLRNLFETKSQQMCIVRLLPKNTEHFYARLESRPVDPGDYVYQCRTAIIDVTERKQTENQLKENEERLFQVIQDLPVMIAAFDDHFNFTLWNRECEQVTGYSSEEIVGNPNAQALLYPDPNYHQDILSAIIDRGKFDNFRNGEWEITCKDGRIKTIAWFNMVKHYPMAGWYRWAIGVDITERKRTEEGLKQSHHDLERSMKEHTIKLTQTTQQLQQETAERKRARQALQISERQYRLLAENVTDGITIVQEERLIFTNNALTSMLGFTGNELLGRELITLIHEDCRESFKETLEQQVKNQTTSQHFQVRWVTKAGREIWIEGEHSMIEWEGKPGILMTMRDITERKQREMALEQEKKRLQKEIFKLKSSIKDRYRFGDIIGKSPVMQNLYEQILKAAKTDANVFIYGESGTGKELIARTIHKLSKRHDQRFIPVNCSAIPEALFESEFFGHRRGSFTGAFRDKQGFFTVAHQGTMSRMLLAKYILKNGVRAFNKWIIPYAKSRVYNSRLRPVISYLFTDWKCNIDCHYCFQFDNTGARMSLETARSSIDWLKTLGCRVIPIMGGEPLIRKDFILEVIRYGSSNGFFMYLPTNGYLRTSAFIKGLPSCNSLNPKSNSVSRSIRTSVVSSSSFVSPVFVRFSSSNVHTSTKAYSYTIFVLI